MDNGVSIQVNLPNCGQYDVAELTRILTQIAMTLIETDSQEQEAKMPCTYSSDEAKALTLQRGRDIRAGRVKLISHDEVMKEMDQLISTYAD